MDVKPSIRWAEPQSGLLHQGHDDWQEGFSSICSNTPDESKHLSSHRGWQRSGWRPGSCHRQPGAQAVGDLPPRVVNDHSCNVDRMLLEADTDR